MEETPDQPLFSKSHTKLNFSSDNLYFYCNPPWNTSDKLPELETFADFYNRV